MSFVDFSKVQYIKTTDTSEEIRIGSFKTVNSLELKYIRLTIVIKGLTNILGEIAIKIFSDPGYTSLLYISDYSDLSDIEIINTSNDQWIGWIRIDFNRENINNKLTYYPTIVTRNYTRTANDYYIGFAYDFPYPIYDNGESKFYRHPLQMQIFGWHER